MAYILDTNILIHKSRNSVIWDYVNQHYLRNKLKHEARISIVSAAEVQVFARRNNWGKPRLRELSKLLKILDPIKFNDDVVEKYIQLDLYSQNAHKSLKLPKPFNARNMGKNDLWIAATAATYQLPLITTDQDFQHLNDVFLDIIYVDIAEILNSQ